MRRDPDYRSELYRVANRLESQQFLDIRSGNLIEYADYRLRTGLEIRFGN